ncbi:MAG: hypothetical protein FD123_257 [Bacteroidetes bacterium]|nr:MAG: hypothetical protein FD123_257 [Bacteroidota bacterium]
MTPKLLTFIFLLLLSPAAHAQTAGDSVTVYYAFPSQCELATVLSRSCKQVNTDSILPVFRSDSLSRGQKIFLLGACWFDCALLIEKNKEKDLLNRFPAIEKLAQDLQLPGTQNLLARLTEHIRIKDSLLFIFSETGVLFAEFLTENDDAAAARLFHAGGSFEAVHLFLLSEPKSERKHTYLYDHTFYFSSFLQVPDKDVFSKQIDGLIADLLRFSPKNESDFSAEKNNRADLLRVTRTARQLMLAR